MSKVQLLRSNINSIFANLSIEEALIANPLKTPTLFIWRNRPTVTIGRHQNPWKECNLQLMDESGVELSRRYSGGGAVYQDLGGTTFTFAHDLSPSDSPSRLIDSNFDILVTAFKSLGLPVSRKGRNDLVLGDQKISGSAFKQSATKLIHHGTILVSTDLACLGKYLTPSKLKLKSKGISSVAARVTNLVSRKPSIDHDVVSEALGLSFRRNYGCSSSQQPTIIDSDMESDPVFVRHHDELRNWNWRYGSTPHFSHTVETRFEGVGIFELHYEVEKGMISNVKIFSDILYPELVDELQSCLLNCPYDAEHITRVLSGLEATQPTEIRKTIVKQFTEWFLYEVTSN